MKTFRLSGRYLFGRIPLSHVLVLALQLLGIGHVSLNFSASFLAKPVLTTMVLNALLNGLADTVAQSVTAVRQHQTRSKVATKRPRRGPSIELRDFGDVPLGGNGGDLYATNSYDVERWIRFMAWGFLMAPLQLHWFALLSTLFPLTPATKTIASLLRMLCDQLFFSPASLALFFVFLTVTEGGGQKAVSRKFNHAFMPSLRANFVVWPLVQIINFRFVTLPAQLPFASTVGVFWTTYLSLKNDAAEATLPVVVH
ncbi:hypothetical protein EX30DRAFT_359361 [Ascodesmis nigricans]|uniref:Uncharacterized protein n=1 Tax=Ascodesmis nigricans TaxID=341454 RepID=A0A4S2MTB1_9PEZI|nr:hypothetical protein EX30DRAFT_359361 [Ascodesmis nigricans]